MSSFEYLQKVTIGQYLPIDSWIHNLDPRAKIAGYSILIIALTVTQSLYGLLIGLITVLLLLMLSKIPWRYALSGLLAPLPFLLLLAIIQLFITPHSLLSFPIIRIMGAEIYSEGIIAGIRLLLRFGILVILLTVSSATLATLEMIHGLDLLLKPLRIPWRAYWTSDDGGSDNNAIYPIPGDQRGENCQIASFAWS